MQFTVMFTQPLRFSKFHGVAASLVLSIFFLNCLSVKNRSLFNFYKKKTAWQFDVRSHVTQDLRDTRLCLLRGLTTSHFFQSML